MDDKGIEKFCINLEKLKNIKFLDLNYYGNNVTKKGFLNLALVVKQIPDLLGFSITF